MLPNQDQFVKWCEDYYFDNRLEPGNPDHGDWEDCHFPKPKCLGGTETILLLREHHAIQGVLQSEEYGHPCIWGWELAYLPEKCKELGRKWVTVRNRKGGKAGYKAMMDSMDPEQRAVRSRKGYKAMMDSMDPGQRAARNKKINRQRWKCLETGHVSSPASLTKYQKNRGIDPSKRQRVA